MLFRIHQSRAGAARPSAALLRGLILRTMLTMIAARPPLSHQGFDQTFGCDLPTLVPAYTLIFAQSRGFVRHSIGCKAMVATLLILQPVRPHSTATSMRLRMPSTLVAKSRMDREPIDGIRKILTQIGDVGASTDATNERSPCRDFKPRQRIRKSTSNAQNLAPKQFLRSLA
jgi:hypothetical protein